MLVEKLTEENFYKTLDDSKDFLIIYFTAPWCGPGQTMTLLIEEIAKEYENKLKISKVNVDENPNISKDQKIESIPMLVFFKDGKRIDEFIGAYDKETIIDKIEEVLEKNQ